MRNLLCAPGTSLAQGASAEWFILLPKLQQATARAGWRHGDGAGLSSLHRHGDGDPLNFSERNNNKQSLTDVGLRIPALLCLVLGREHKAVPALAGTVGGTTLETAKHTEAKELPKSKGARGKKRAGLAASTVFAKQFMQCCCPPAVSQRQGQILETSHALLQQLRLRTGKFWRWRNS